MYCGIGYCGSNALALRYVNKCRSRVTYRWRMIAVVYRCPTTGLCVDHWFQAAEKPETYETVPCRACNGVHLVNVTTGRVLVATDQSSASAIVWPRRAP